MDKEVRSDPAGPAYLSKKKANYTNTQCERKDFEGFSQLTGLDLLTIDIKDSGCLNSPSSLRP